MRDLQLFIVSTEPTPYKVDLYNAFCDKSPWDITVLYAVEKNWDWDAGHNYKLLPDTHFKHETYVGKGLRGQLLSSLKIMLKIFSDKPDILIVCTYMGLPYVSSMLSALLMRIPFAMWTDQFNVGDPPGQDSIFLKKAVRNFIRKIIFQNALAVLVCGKPGIDSAQKVGCPPAKLIDFPYVVDPRRLKHLAATANNSPDIRSLSGKRPIILFSGRLVRRKGLHILLLALERLYQSGDDFFLVIEGDGPLRKEYEQMVVDLELTEQSCFVGFMQMDEHAYLLDLADIIVIPSSEDPWGIVVHEGMLMGKPVIASDAVGAALDRISSGKNGIVFPSGNYLLLSQHIKKLLNNKKKRNELGRSAKELAEYWSPERNAEVFIHFVEN